jgi:ligand-binding sensor domain-containing protein
VIKVIYEDDQQRLWFSVKSQGLYLKASASQPVVHFQHDAKISTTLDSDFVMHITQTDKGQLWVATVKGVNWLIDQNGQFKRYQLPIKPSIKPIMLMLMLMLMLMSMSMSMSLHCLKTNKVVCGSPLFTMVSAC